MRLLNTCTYQLRTFASPEITPRYTILSHCWTEDEVDFSDIQDLTRARSHRGWAKVEGACAAALSQGYDWVWLDTCCIDKSSSAELSEAINSMFTWYGRAGICLVYLSDVGDEDPHEPQSSFRHSRWFTRGWTLQELIAPGRSVIFFSHDWRRIGFTPELAPLLEEITTIDAAVLLSDDAAGAISQLSIARRMAWAAGRHTTRPEDRAYALMGMFDVNIPILYGEGGERAFRRLQLEIISHTFDHSIFAWGPRAAPARLLARAPAPGHPLAPPVVRLLALSPDDFRDSADIVRVAMAELTGALGLRTVKEPHFFDTHYGIRIRLPLCPVLSHAGGRVWCAALACRTSASEAPGLHAAWIPPPKFIGLVLYRPHSSPVYVVVQSMEVHEEMSPGLSRAIDLPYPLAKRRFPYFWRSEWRVETIYIWARAVGEESELSSPSRNWYTSCNDSPVISKSA